MLSETKRNSSESDQKSIYLIIYYEAKRFANGQAKNSWRIDEKRGATSPFLQYDLTYEK